MISIITGDLSDTFIDQALDVRQIGMDIETTGLDRETDRLATIQFYLPAPYDEVTILRNIDEWPNNLTKVLESTKIKKIFHYALLDLTFIMRDYSFIYPQNIADTKIAAKLYDKDKKIFGSHSLKTLLNCIYGITLDKTIAVSDWTQETLSLAQMDYAANDVRYLPALLDYLENGIVDYNTRRALFDSYAYLPSRVMLDLKLGKDVYGYA